MIRRTAFALLLTFPAAWAADEALPKAETILDRYVEVTGGKAAYEKHKTELGTGTMTFTAQGLKGSISRYAAAPNQTYAVIELEGIGKIEQGPMMALFSHATSPLVPCSILPIPSSSITA